MANVVDVLQRKSLVEYIPEAVQTGDGTYRCPCPIHHGNNPTSFAIFPNNRYYCFSCGSHGDIIKFVMERDEVPLIPLSRHCVMTSVL